MFACLVAHTSLPLANRANSLFMSDESFARNHIRMLERMSEVDVLIYHHNGTVISLLSLFSPFASVILESENRAGARER